MFCIIYPMQTAVIAEEQVRIENRPDPVPGNGEILVEVRAAGLNGADLLQRRGRYPAPPDAPQDIPGLEYAGSVLECGPGATRFQVGDRVMGIVGGGGQAQRVVVHERLAMPVPDGVDWPAAGCIPEVFCTAYDALFTQAGLRLGEKLLVNGAAGGVGTAAVQLARLAGARPFATIRHSDMADRVAELGAVPVVAEAGADAAVEQGPFDVVLELVGAANLKNGLRALARRGRYCFIGVGGGPKCDFNALHVMNKRASIHGSTLRSETLEVKAALARELERHVLPHFATGALRVPVDATFPLEKVEDAYEHFAAGHKFGKVALVL